MNKLNNNDRNLILIVGGIMASALILALFFNFWYQILLIAAVFGLLSLLTLKDYRYYLWCTLGLIAVFIIMCLVWWPGAQLLLQGFLAYIGLTFCLALVVFAFMGIRYIILRAINDKVHAKWLNEQLNNELTVLEGYLKKIWPFNLAIAYIHVSVPEEPPKKKK